MTTEGRSLLVGGRPFAFQQHPHEIEHRVITTAAAALTTVLLTLGAAPFSWTTTDPRGDDKGPGTYQYPSGDMFTAGSFDLRRLTVRLEGDDVVFEVELGAQIKKPVEVRLSDATLLELGNGIYVQNVDIYVDRDPSGGVLESIPGRRVRFVNDAGWEAAIVLAPQPFVVRSGLDDWAPGRGKVIIPTDVRSENRTVRARVSITDLGGVPDPSWGFQVLVTGAAWQPSFDAFRRVTGSHAPNALTLKVTTIAETTAFGGGELHDQHPYVIDLLAPPGREQAQILRSFDVEAERYAVVPMVYVDPRARARVQSSKPMASSPASPGAATRPPGASSALTLGLIPSTRTPTTAPRPAGSDTGPIVATVQSVDGDIVVLDKPARRINRFQLGAVFDTDGTAVGRVVLNQEYPAFLLATAVEGVGRIRAGATVRFDPPKE